MPTRAGLQSKPVGARITILSSTIAFSGTTTRLARRPPSTFGRFIMSIVSGNRSNLSTASGAEALYSCRLLRSHGSWRAEPMLAVPCRNWTTKLGIARAAPAFAPGGCFSTLGIRCNSDELSSGRSALSAGSLEWQGGPGTSKLGFLKWRAIHGVVSKHGFGSRREFRIVSRQEGRYICAEDEDFRLEKTFGEYGVGLEAENGVGRGVETVGTDAVEVERKACSPEIWVVNFYYFVGIEDPHHEVARHTSFLEGKDVRGRIYISHQGINAQLSGPEKETAEYAEWVKEDSRFADMLVQISPSPGGHAFPRLKLRYKPSLVQVEGGTLHLPITDPSARAVHLCPREWTERLDAAAILGKKSAAGSQELGNSQDEQRDKTIKARKPVVLLDVRNGYEWDVGHFKGAQRPDVDCFKSTEFGLKENGTGSSDPLANVDKEKVDVMMYCTGGIRCDVFSAMLRQKGFKNLYTLKGGVSNYLKEEGARKWAGNLFVFDARLAVPPKDYGMKGSLEEQALLQSYTTEEMNCASSSATQAFARCRVCGDTISEPRHRNCANLDCNVLYMSCDDCRSQHNGCCSASCSTAPRLRPLLASHQYDRWHNYRPQEPKPPKPADYISRRALKRRRRKERRKLLATEQPSVQILDSHVALIEIHDEGPNFIAIGEARQ